MPEKMEYKQVIVVDWSLRLRCGKIAAQAAHAAMMFLVTEDPRESEFSRSAMDFDFSAWMDDNGMAKVIVKAESPEELNRIEDRAREAGLRVRSVIDEGRTVFNGVATKTCICIGPNDSKVIDTVTGKLKLL